MPWCQALFGSLRQRVAIAGAPVRARAFSVADEAVGAADARVRKQVPAVLAELHRRRHVACLFATHDLGVLEEIADRIDVMQQARIVEEGWWDAVLDTPRRASGRALVSAAPRLPRREPDTGTIGSLRQGYRPAP